MLMIFSFRVAFPFKACSSVSSTVVGKSLFANNLLTLAILMMLLCENEKLPHEYSNHPSSKFSVNKPKRFGPFDRQMDTVSNLVKT